MENIIKRTIKYGVRQNRKKWMVMIDGRGMDLQYAKYNFAIQKAKNMSMAMYKSFSRIVGDRTEVYTFDYLQVEYEGNEYNWKEKEF